MKSLIKEGMSFYRQDNSALERTLQYFRFNKESDYKPRITHVLCGNCMLGNGHVLANYDMDSKLPENVQLEDYFHAILGNPNVYRKYLNKEAENSTGFWPSDDRYYEWLTRFIWGMQTITRHNTVPTVDKLKALIDHNIPVGVLWKKSNGYLHYVVVSGYSDTQFQIVDSAPDLAHGNMFYNISNQEVFANRYITFNKRG